MYASPSDPVSADLGALLNRATLHLSPDVKAATLTKERVALKYRPGRGYLVVTPRQWETLQAFKDGKTVTSVLCNLIAAQRNPSLRELYELVIKAVRAGVLQTSEHPLPSEQKPASWPVRLNGTAVRWMTVAAALGATGCLFLRPVTMPESAQWLGLGWLAACVAASFGAILAASVLRAADGEVYRLHFGWKTFLPGLRADLGDTLLGGKGLGVNVALAQLAPHFLFLCLAAWRWPGLQLPVLAGTLIVLSPLWPSPVRELLGALYRDIRLSTEESSALGAGRWAAWVRRVRLELHNRGYYLACLAAGVVWIGLTVALVVRFLPAEVRARFGWSETLASAQQAGMVLGLALGVMAALAVLGAVVWLGWAIVSWWRERAERRLRPQAVLVSPQTIAEWLGRTVMFRDLPAEELAAVAATVKSEEHRRGSFVVREGEPGEKLYIVLSGRLEVRRDYAPGRSEPVAEMGEGDVFGEIALLHGGPRTRSIRSLGRSVLLALDKAEFERLVLTKLSRQAVADAVQKVGFLQHTELTRNWSHATRAAFARRAMLREAEQGSVVLAEGAANHWFFLVHRGELTVSVKGKELRTLKPGDSFGELSLLGNGYATATVTVASKLASVLVIPARDFLEFVSQDFIVGLGWEGTRKDRKER
jgi:CRP-like cAMP-binding protein